MNRTKRRIFNTAMKLFSEKGYDNTNVEEITAVAGVAKGSLYYHFQKKEDIFYLLIDEGVKLLKNSVEIKTKKCKNNLEKIKAIILIQIKVTVKYEDLINVIFSQMWGKDKKSLQCRNAIYTYIEIIKKIVEDGIMNGEFKSGNSDAIASEIFGTTCSSLVYRMRTNETVDIENIYKEFIETITSGICYKTDHSV